MKLAASVFAAVVVLASSLVFADTYAVDPVHSFAMFRIRHMNTSWVYGRINGPEGTINYDAAAPEKSSFEITLKAENIDTAVAARDNHLKSPTFFNAKEYPTLTFKSTSVKKADDTHLDVTGDLTIHGVTKSVTISLEVAGTGKDMKGKPIIGFESTFTIKRSDFGMKEFAGVVGDEVRITVAMEADQK